MTLIRLTSDDFQGELLTPDAYEAIVLSMSTGDYSTHKAEVFIMPETDERAEAAYELSLDILESFEV